MLRPSITPNWKAGWWVDRTNKHNWKQYLYRDLFRYVVLINPYIRPSGRVNKYLQTKAGINYVQPQPANSGNECGISCTVAVEKLNRLLNRLLFQLFLSLSNDHSNSAEEHTLCSYGWWISSKTCTSQSPTLEMAVGRLHRLNSSCFLRIEKVE